MKLQEISVRAARHKYWVVCGPGAIAGGISRLGDRRPYSRCVVCSSPNVWRAVGRTVARQLGVQRGDVFLMDDRESAKNLGTVESLCSSLSRARVDRRALLVAVGGGVVGDVAGFVAASYLRGIALVHVPTTVVAQVDSAIGGKTGVNLPEGKNLVGAFYPPRLVLTEPRLLDTLPELEFKSGLAEVIKYGVIADKALFQFLEDRLENLLARQKAALEWVIYHCAKIKASVVSRDETERGLREILNFGHTFGHALESVTRYRKFRHGEAVAWGMVAAALLGHEAGITPADDTARIIGLVRRLRPLPQWPRISANDFLRAMSSDKKARGGILRFVLTPGIGRARTFGTIRQQLVERVLNYAPHVLEAPGRSHA